MIARGLLICMLVVAGVDLSVFPHGPARMSVLQHPSMRVLGPPHQRVSRRKFPYPYSAMLALSSDADGMTVRKFVAIHRFLNTREHTSLGLGLGLDIADSFFFFIGTDRPGICASDGTLWKDQMSYFYRLAQDTPRDAAAIVAWTKAGWIDTLHGLGDFSREDVRTPVFSRLYAQTAARAMRENQLHYTVWVNHGNTANVGNFGDPESRYQQGDVKGSPYYITDLMLPLGVRFVWTRRDSDFGLRSMLYPIRLRDGHRVWGFYRYTDDGYSALGHLLWNWNPRRLGAQLSSAHLTALETSHAYAIVAQHLGGDATRSPFYGDNLEGLVRLMHEYRHGRILVARTSRLLRYNAVEQFLRWHVQSDPAHPCDIVLDRVQDPVIGTYIPSRDDVRGMTFYTKDPLHARILLHGQALPSSLLKVNAADDTGQQSVSVTWWPPDTRDYSKAYARSHNPLIGPPIAHAQWAPSGFLWREDAL